MSLRNSFIRKIFYLSAIAVLLMPLFWLSQPATNAAKGVQGSPGGKLAQLRQQHHLSQAQLGEIDPTSVTIKLATLGLRGVAANILWEKANTYKMKKDWTNFGATLNQITKVQPNFINVWINQAWNLSYNCSIEFDDYRERYRWVIKGFNFLMEGIAQNDRQPRLLYELGRMISQKIGKADEKKQYRRLFAQDEDFRGSLPADMRDACLDYRGRLDNWLVGKKWYEKAIDMVDSSGTSMMGQSPLIYRSSGPMCQMYYAEAVEKDGTFGEVAKGAWAGAAGQWQRYSVEDIPTSFQHQRSGEPIVIRLNDQEAQEEAAQKLLARLEAIQPGLREKIIAEKRDELTAGQREALDIPVEKRTGKQWQLARQAEEAVKVAHDEVARRITGLKRKEAIQLAKDAAEHEWLASCIRRYRDIVNFLFWRRRAQAEQSREILTARQLVYQGDRAYSEGDLIVARNFYRDGLAAWREALDAHKEYVTDQSTRDDLMDMIIRYRRILSQLDEPFPEKFILQDVIDAQQRRPGTATAKEEEK